MKHFLLLFLISLFNANNHIIKRVYFVIPLVCSLHAFGQNESFYKVFDFDSTSIAYKALQTPDGGYIVAGGIKKNNDDVYLLKLDSNGDTLWTKTFGDNSRDWAVDICITADDQYLVVGRKDHYIDISSNGEAYGKIWILKFDVNGEIIWSKAYGDDFNNYAKKVVKTKDGGYIVSGVKGNQKINYMGDAWVLKLDELGDTVWTKTLHFSNYLSEGNSIIESSENEYIITGSTSIGSLADAGIFCAKLTYGGDTLWTRVFEGYSGNDIVETADTCYIIVGRSSCQDVQMKINNSGDVIWTENFNSLEYCYHSNAICLNTNGNFVTVGNRIDINDDINYPDDFWIKYCFENGDTLRSNIFNFSLHDIAYSVNKTTDSRYIVAGQSNNYACILKLNSDISLSSQCQHADIQNQYFNILGPVDGEITINFDCKLNVSDVEICLYNSLGSKIYKDFVNNKTNGQIIINTANLVCGLYILSITNNRNIYISKSVIIL